VGLFLGKGRYDPTSLDCCEKLEREQGLAMGRGGSSRQVRKDKFSFGGSKAWKMLRC